METVAIDYGQPAVSGTARTGYAAMPPNFQYPARVNYYLSEGKHGIFSHSLKMPFKQVFASSNYAKQGGVSAWNYKINTKQMGRVRLNPVPAETVPIGAQIMRVVGRAAGEDNTGSPQDIKIDETGKIIQLADGQRINVKVPGRSMPMAAKDEE